MKYYLTHHPLGFAFILTAAVAVIGGAIPNALLGQALQLALACALISVFGWWREAGFTPPVEWHNFRLLLVPTLFALAPLLWGVRPAPALPMIAVFSLVAATSEEAISRGLLLQALHPLGIRAAILISAVLFGALHLLGLAFGRDPMYVLVQVVFNIIFGVVYGLVRVRTNTIWPLILLHALGNTILKGISPDLMPFEGALVAYALFAAYGLVLLWVGVRRSIVSSKTGKLHAQ